VAQEVRSRNSTAMLDLWLRTLEGDTNGDDKARQVKQQNVLDAWQQHVGDAWYRIQTHYSCQRRDLLKQNSLL
jgi:hypothetical protein